MSRRAVAAAELLTRAQAGDRRAVGRLISLAENPGPQSDDVAALTHPLTGHASVVGITGAPGAGKSTLCGHLAAHLAGGGSRVAVLAIDPTSPLSGGAVLGDRIRMDTVVPPSVFIRSMASRGERGGLSLAAPAALRVLDAAGFDVVLLETVGVGQVEVDVASAADTTVVVVTPGWGDAVQVSKAGLFELADVFVVNKADRPGAADARRDLEHALDLTPATTTPQWRPPVVPTTATAGAGTVELAAAVAAHRDWLADHGELERRRAARLRAELLHHAVALIERDVVAALDGPAGRALLAAVVERKVAPSRAARTLIEQPGCGG